MPVIATRHVGAMVFLAVVPAVVAARQHQTVTVSFAQEKVALWTTAVETHTAGKVDGPVRSIAAWKREYVTLVLRLVLPKANADTLARALSLHTDIAIAERESLLRQSPSSGTSIILVDGRETREVGRSYHWAIARQIAAALAALPGEGPRVAAWYRAIGAGLQQWGDYDTVTEHLQAGLALFGDDPMLALYQGTLHQLHGDARLQDYMRTHASAAAPRRPRASKGAVGRGQPRGGVVSRLPGHPTVHRPAPSDLRRVPKASREQLEAAEREFRHALSLDPGLHEARIRLAHVLSALGDDRAAVDTIRPLLAAPLAPFFEFYAALILGRSEEHLGRYAEAGDAYARAAARFPGAQSAQIGRSRVALAQGRAAEALASVIDVTSFNAPERDDPWLSYLREHDPDGASQIDAWRKALR